MLNENLSDYERLLQYALWFISKKRYTCLGIQKKLQQFFKKHLLKDLAAMERVMERLTELNYLDDVAYAKDYVSDRLRFNPRGKLLLQRELRLKGIPKEMCGKILNEGEVDELAMAKQLLGKKRFDFTQELPQKEKARIYRFLASKGFGKEIIYKALQSPYNRD